jgi:NTE family protein
MTRPSIGVALSGGAARGIAHVGVLKAFRENNIPIDYIAGTSAGSLVGAAVASGMSIEDIEKLSKELRWRRIGRPTISRLGFQSNKLLEDFVRARLPITRFEDLLIPFAAVATDLGTGAAVVMKDNGDVPLAVRASCCIPGVYVPVIDSEGRQLVDGGLVAVLPATVVREMGADIVVSVDVNSCGASFFGSSLTHLFGVILQSMMLIQRNVSQRQQDASDLVIHPKISHIRWDQLRRADDLLKAGYDAGQESIPALRALCDAVDLTQRRRGFLEYSPH